MTIKPMIYYEALNYGMSPLSKFKSEPTTFYIDKKAYTFNNFNNKYENNKITMGYALATSDNIYAVKTHLYIGSDKLINFLTKFNVEVKDKKSTYFHRAAFGNDNHYAAAVHYL